MKTQNINELATEVEQEIGSKISEKKRQFALLKLTHPGKTNAELAREVGANPTTAKQVGYQWANDPKVLAMMDKISSVMDFPVDESNLTTDMITKGLAKEAFEAKNSRDRREAFHLLGKSKGMFKDVIETVPERPVEEFLAEVEIELGKELRDLMAKELSVDE